MALTYEELIGIQNKRKKQEEQAQKATSKATSVASTKPYAQRLVSPANDIAPVKKFTPTTTTKAKPTVTTSTKKKEDDRTWFKKSSYFDDGYDFGDITKTILGSVADVGENIGTGIAGMGEKVVDALAVMGTALGNSQMQQNTNDALAFSALKNIGKDKNTKEKEAQSIIKNNSYFQSQAKKGTTEFVAKDLYDEEQIAKAIISAPIKEYTGMDVESASVFGEKSDALVQSAGQLLATAGLQAVGVPWFLTTGATSFGAEAEGAFKEGATFEQGAMSAVVSAGAEILSEKLSGGIKFGGKTLDDVLLKPLTEKITNKVAKSLVDLGLDALGEGFEEVFSGVVSNLGSTLYKEESIGELLASEEAFDEYLESFIGGMVLGGVSSTAKAVADRNKIELSENEQKVYDKVVEERINEEKESGTEVTKKKEAEIRNAVLQDMLKGYIDTDTIESVLGGEAYKTYKDTVDNETALQKEFDTLNKMKQGEMTGEQLDRRAELKQQLEELKNNSKTSEMKTKLGEDVFNLVKDNRLSESYNERYRRGQTFEADLSKYDTKQQETIKKAIESGILNNTNRTHEFVDMVAKISADKGVLFDFVNNEKLKASGFAVEGKTVNGYKTNEGNIAINIESSKALDSIVGHEITHILEGTELYEELQNAVTEYAKTKGEYTSRLQALRKMYEGVYKGEDFDDKIRAELTADIVGEYLFTDADFVNRLSAEKPNVFKKLYDEIKYLCKIATAGSKEARELEKVKHQFEKAYKESAKSGAKGEGVKYSLSDNNITKTDNKYLSAVESGDTETAQRMVDEVAKKNGYTEKVYHGTTGFGFTKLDASKGDDGISFFATDSLDVARTYSGGDEVRNISDEGMSEEDYDSLIESYDEKVRDFIDVVCRTSGYYNFMSYRDNRFDDFRRAIENGTDSFDNVSSDLLEYVDEIVDSLFDNALYYDDSLAEEDFYESDEIQKVYDAFGDIQHILKGIYDYEDGSVGNYQLFANTEGLLEIDAEGKRWNQIPFDKYDPAGLHPVVSTRQAARYAKYEGYKGVKITNVFDDGGRSTKHQSKPATVYIFFNPQEQVKSADTVTYDDNGNVIPLSERFKAENNDIRFSLSENVEETKKLMALHNLHSNELMKQLKMGGIPYPSVAVTKPDTLSHEGFGDITLILNKDAIDPKKSKYNKLYSADAYTPTFPNVKYEASRDVANNIADKVKSLYGAIPEDYNRSLTAFRDYTNIDERLNSARGEEGLIERYLDDYSFKQLYLADKGEVVPTEIKRTETQITEYQKEQYQFVVNKLGVELLESSKPMDSYTPPLTARLQWYEQNGEALKEAYAEYWADDGKMTKEEALEIANSEGARYWVRQIKAITDYIKTGGITIKEEADMPSTNALIDEKINVAEYKEWLTDLFSGIEGSSGIRNSKDLFTPSGKRRSFSQLHDPVTIDNVIKAMRKQEQTGQGAFGTGNIQGASVQEFGSISEMKANADRLGVMDEAEHEEITQQINDRIFEIAEKYSNGKDLMDAQTTIVEAVSKNETKAGIARYLKQFDYVYKYTDSIGDDIIELRDYIRSLPTPYFEAKPQRAVNFDEVAAFVIPRDADIKVKQELLNKGYSIAEYDPKIEGDRQRVVNSFEQYKFSLSDANETPSKYGRFFGKDVLYRGAEDIAPMQKTSVAEESSGVVNEADYAPMTEAEANAMWEEQKDSINTFTDADMPPEIEAPIYTDDSSSLDKKTLSNIANTVRYALSLSKAETKAIQDIIQRYSTSEQKNEDALFEEIKAQFGEKSWTEKNAEIAQVKQVLRGFRINVSPTIKRDIPDYAQFRKRNFGKILFANDGMDVDKVYMTLSDHYPSLFPDSIANATDQLLQIAEVVNTNAYDTRTDMLDDETIREATELIADVVNTYNEQELLKGAKAQEREFLKNAKKYESEMPVMSDDFAPVKEVAKATPAPTEITDNSSRTDENVIGESQIGTKAPTKKKGGTWSDFVRNFVSKGAVFETTALKKNNRALEDKYKMWKDRSEGKAQYFMEHGKGDVKSLKSIVDKVKKAGLYNEFDLYLAHRHNISRMQYDKAVFGDAITGEMSLKAAGKLQKEHPEFKKWAKEVYKYNDYLLQKTVEGGLISQEFANELSKKYPNYVPIERILDENGQQNADGVFVGNPIKTAIGGNQSFESPLKAMAHRTTQVFKAVDKNAFGVELKNTLGGEAEVTGMNADDVLDGLATMDNNLLQAGVDGKNPTFTVFENGERVTFEISEEMYKALQPTTEAMSREHKIVSVPSKLHKKVLTEYNLFFTARNFPKDAQEVLINSKHAAKTYANMPVAVAELLKGEGKYLTEYWENGGKSNTYFDGRENDFTKDDGAVKKVIGFLPNGISKVNDFVEAIPRLAEYIASRKNGATIEGAMLDAARVTTDFSDGGDVTKFFNRNGVTFLNASVQGFSQQVRNVRQAKAEGFKGIAKLVGKYAMAGLPALLFNSLMWDDDEEYEELSEYVKDNYYVIAKYGDGQFVRIPKGRTAAVLQEIAEQAYNILTGETTGWDGAKDSGLAIYESFMNNIAPSNPLENNVIAPIMQAASNKTWYGEDLVPTRLQDVPAKEQYDEATDSISKWLGENTGISPYKINYLLNQYSGFIGDIVLPGLTPEAERGDDSFVGNLLAPLKDQFVVDGTIKNRNPSDFYSLKDELNVNANSKDATNEDKLKYKYIESVGYEMGDLYKQKREVQNSNLSDDLKYKQVRDIQEQINEIAKKGLESYENVKIEKNYATVGGVQYRLDENKGSWQKLYDDEIEKMNDATKALGITPGEYWSNKDEYNMQAFNPDIYEVLQQEGISVAEYKEKYENFIHMRSDDYSWAAANPGRYSVAKVFSDDFKEYRELQNELFSIKGDPDGKGGTVYGTQTQNRRDFIASLSLDEGQKAILYRINSDSKTDQEKYNDVIVDYLNSRDDISYDEMKTILEELGATVDSKGYISWD